MTVRRKKKRQTGEKKKSPREKHDDFYSAVFSSEDVMKHVSKLPEGIKKILLRLAADFSVKLTGTDGQEQHPVTATQRVLMLLFDGFLEIKKKETPTGLRLSLTPTERGLKLFSDKRPKGLF